MIPTKEELKKGCSMCFETSGAYPLKDLRDADDTIPSVKAQAMLLIEMGYKESDNKGCGLIVAKTRDGEIKCGEDMWGKKRYCAYCSQKTSTKNSHQVKKDEDLIGKSSGNTNPKSGSNNDIEDSQEETSLVTG